MKLSQEQEGEIIIFGKAVLWSLFPIMTTLTYSSLSPLASLSWTTVFAALFFGIILTIRKKWGEIKNISAMKDIAMAALLIGICYYGFMFWGIQKSSPGNVSIIALSEIFFSFLFFNMWKKEYFDRKHILGAIFVIAGAIIVLLPQELALGKGDSLILIATMFAPFGNFFQKRARKKVSTEMIMFLRSLFIIPFFFGASYLLGEMASAETLKTSLWFLIINGMVLMGIAKILLIEGIHRISVTKAISMSSISPLFTMIFSYFILKDMPTTWQLLSFIPMFIGVMLLTLKKSKQAKA